MFTGMKERSASSVFLDRGLDVLDYARKGLLVVAVASCFGAGFLIVLNVVMRQVFASSIAGVVEFTSSALMVAIVYAALGSAPSIRLRMGLDRLPKAVRKWVWLSIEALETATFGLLAYASLKRALESLAANELNDDLVRFPIYPWRFVIVLGFTLAFVAAVFGVVAALSSRPRLVAYRENRLGFGEEAPVEDDKEYVDRESSVEAHEKDRYT